MISRMKLDDIKQGSYIGVSGLPQPDGSQKALEIHIFPEAMRGVGEGHRPAGRRGARVRVVPLLPGGAGAQGIGARGELADGGGERGGGGARPRRDVRL